MGWYHLPRHCPPFWPMLCSQLFTAMADGLAWCMMCEGVSHFLHYLDDFFCPPCQAQDCGQSLAVAVRLCQDLGFPVAPDKVVGPSSTLTFLGIELDSVSMVMRLPSQNWSTSRPRWADGWVETQLGRGNYSPSLASCLMLPL